jgi:uncharacterized protein YkvS
MMIIENQVKMAVLEINVVGAVLQNAKAESVAVP